MQTAKVEFTAERETMLFTLYGKALQSRTPDPILPDPWAEDAIKHIDYDFGKLKVREYESTIIAIRSKQFDVLASRFITEQPDATVLQLGCGMDSRIFRLNPPKTVSWFDVDYPDVIELRRQLYPERPAYTMIGSALEDQHWMELIPEEQPVMVIAEGVMMYLTEEIVRSLLNRLTHHFLNGMLVFDAWNQLTLKGAQRRGIKGTGATFGWAIDDPESIKTIDDRFELVLEIGARRLAAFHRMPWWSRAIVHLTDPITALRRANRILVYRF